MTDGCPAVMLQPQKQAPQRGSPRTAGGCYSHSMAGVEASRMQPVGDMM
jgi:hypothetical protein